MEQIDINSLKLVVDRLKEYRKAQALAYYNHKIDEDIEVSECTSMQRLLLIADATKSQVKSGLRDKDGATITRVVVWEGCRFWAPINS